MSDRPRRRPARALLIATAPRSGSWLLSEGLRGLGVAGRPEEFFRADIEDVYRARWRVPPDAPYQRFLHRVLAAGRTPNGVFAAKVHLFQFAHLLRQLHRAGGPPRCDVDVLESWFGPLRFVYLHRLDTLRQAVSWHRAIGTDDWWRLRADTRQRPPCLEYDFEAIKHLYFLLRDYKVGWARWFDENDVVPLDLTYENLANDYPGSLAAVQEHLGLRAVRAVPPPRLRRQADGWTEVCVRDFASSWHDLFTGDGVPVTANGSRPSP